EAFSSWFSASPFEQGVQLQRMFGPYAVWYWALILCNVLIPQALWSRRIRSSPAALFVIALVVNTGMWLERYIIVVTSLSRDFVPSSWGLYSGTIWDWMTFI